MRPLLATVALAAVVFTLGACENDKKANPYPTSAASGSSPGSGGSPKASPSPGGSDKVSVCAGYQKAQGELEAKLIVVLPKAAEGMGDPAKAGPALTELKGVMTAFEASLTAEAGRAQDAELKAAINADLVTLHKTIADLQAAGNDVEKALAALQTDEFKAAGEKVRTICEK